MQKKISKKCSPDSTDPDCLPPVPVCFRGSSDPRCQQTQFKINPCESGSTDPRCIKQRITIVELPQCFPNSKDPSCVQQITQLNCVSGSRDPRCRQSSVPVVPQTSFIEICKVNPLNPICHPIDSINEIPFDCSNDPNDERCIGSFDEVPEIQCHPGSLDPKCQDNFVPQEPSVSPKIPKICFPNTNDPECAGVKVVKIKPHTIEVPDTPLQVLCPPGSTNPLCNRSTQRLKCILHPDDISCASQSSTEPPCEIGSLDPRCTQAHRESTFQTKPTIRPSLPQTTTPFIERTTLPKCFPGSTDPRCPKIIPLPLESVRCKIGSTDPRCPESFRVPNQPIAPIVPRPQPIIPSLFTVPPIRTTRPKSVGKQLLCREGSKDPNCIKKEISVDQDIFSCTRFSDDPRCKIESLSQPVIEREPIFPITQTPKSIEELPPRVIVTPINCVNGLKDSKCTKLISIVPRQPNSCKPGSNNPNCKSKQILCTPDSVDPICLDHKKIQEITPRQPVIDCASNPFNPACKKVIVTSPATPTVPIKEQCTPGSNEINCKTVPPKSPRIPALRCSPFSNDPRCPQTTPRTEPRVPDPPGRKPAVDCSINPRAPNCVPPQDQNIQIECREGSTDPKCQLTPPIDCLLGAKTPKCHNWDKHKGTGKPKIPKIPEVQSLEDPHILTITTFRPAIRGKSIADRPPTEQVNKLVTVPKVPFPRRFTVPLTKEEKENIVTSEKPIFPPRIAVTEPSLVPFLPTKVVTETQKKVITTEQSLKLDPSTTVRPKVPITPPVFPPKLPGIPIRTTTPPIPTIRGRITSTSRDPNTTPTSFISRTTTVRHPTRPQPRITTRPENPVIKTTQSSRRTTPRPKPFEATQIQPSESPVTESFQKQRERTTEIIPTVPGVPIFEQTPINPIVPEDLRKKTETTTVLTPTGEKSSTRASVPRFPPSPITTPSSNSASTTRDRPKRPTLIPTTRPPTTFRTTQQPKIKEIARIQTTLPPPRVTRPQQVIFTVPTRRPSTFTTSKVETIPNKENWERKTPPSVFRPQPTTSSPIITTTQQTFIRPQTSISTSYTPLRRPTTDRPGRRPSTIRPTTRRPNWPPQLPSTQYTTTRRPSTHPTFTQTYSIPAESTTSRPNWPRVTSRGRTTTVRKPRPTFPTDRPDKPLILTTSNPRIRPTTQRVPRIRVPNRKTRVKTTSTTESYAKELFRQKPSDDVPSFPPRIKGVEPSYPQNIPPLERGESKVSTRRPFVTTKRPPRTRPSKTMMHGKDDFHKKGMDPRYHAFHARKCGKI